MVVMGNWPGPPGEKDVCPVQLYTLPGRLSCTYTCTRIQIHARVRLQLHNVRFVLNLARVKVQYM